MLDPLQHPNPRVRRLGFTLDAPYVERVWVGLVGPSATLLLRRLPDLWRQSIPAEVDVDELASSLGLGFGTKSWNGRIWRALHRLAIYGLATRIEADGVGVYAQVAPVSDRQLDRLPSWTARTHGQLWGDHLEGLGAGATGVRGSGSEITARLDRLQYRPSVPTTPEAAR